MTKASSIVQNEKTNLEDIPAESIDETVQKITTDIFDNVIKNEDWRKIIDDLGEALISELCGKPLLTGGLDLSDKQKQVIKNAMPRICNSIEDKYIANIQQDERTQKIAEAVEHNVRRIAERVLSKIGAEVNRGALISCVAIAANAKNEARDEITLLKSKDAGDITIPTQCFLISTNCIEIIQRSAVVKTPKKGK